MNIDEDIERLVTIDRFAATHCRDNEERAWARLWDFVSARQQALAEDEVSDYALAAAAREMPPPAKSEKQAAQDVGFVFLGEDWRADLAIPADATVETELTVRLSARENAPIASGLFTIAGVTLPVEEGHVKLPFGVFLTGMKDTKVALTRPEGKPVPGSLVFL